MRKYIVYKTIGLAMLAAVIAGCDTASQEPSPVISPDGYPVATFTTDFTGTEISECNSIVYTITTDKMIDRSVTFRVIVDTATADDHDWVSDPAVLQPYTTETVLTIDFPAEDIVEATEMMKFEIGVTSLADKYLINPSTVNPVLDLDIVNVNEAGKLTLNLEWFTDDDIDMVTYRVVNPDSITPWGDGGASSHNPEIDKSIWLDDPVGDYLVCFMYWGAPPFDWVVKAGYPDGTFDTFTGYFDSNDLGQYTEDIWTAWGGGYESYRILKVTNSGTAFTVTEL